MQQQDNHKRVGRIIMYKINNDLKPPKELCDKDVAKMVPAEYHKYLPLFKKSLAKKLPSHRPYNHRIDLEPGFVPPFGPLYSLNKQGLEALRLWLDENLSKGFICATSSPAGALILFVKNKDGSLRLCVGYRGLNAGTVKNRPPLSLICKTLNQLSKAKIYTALDICSAYNLI